MKTVWKVDKCCSGLICMYDRYIFLLRVSSAKVYIDKKLKRNAVRAPDDLIGDILHHSSLSKKELYAAITELQIGGVETVSSISYKDAQFDLFLQRIR